MNAGTLLPEAKAAHLGWSPNADNYTFSWTMVGVWSGALAMLAATLRDRKLIGRRTEMPMMGVPFLFFAGLVVGTSVLHNDGVANMRYILDPIFMWRAWREVPAGL